MKRERKVVIWRGGFFGGRGGGGRQGRHSSEITRLPGLSLLLPHTPCSERSQLGIELGTPVGGRGTPYRDVPLDRVCFLSFLS